VRLIIKKNTILNFLSIFFYKIILDLSYFFVISPVWGYAKFSLSPNILKLAESFFLLIVIFVLMPKSKEKLSNIMIWLLILISYVPLLTLFALMDQSRAYMYAVTGFWMLVFLLLKSPSVSTIFFKKSQSKIISYSMFFGLFLTVFLMIYKYFGFFLNFDLTKVYEIRSEYAGMEIPLAGYLFTWLAYIINPVFFVFFLVKRKWIPVFFIVFLQILIFSSTGLKAFLFIIPFVLVLTWVATRKNPLFYLSAGLIGIIMLGMISYWLVDDVWISSLFTRRTLLIPSQLSFFYYDFFQEHEPTFLSQHRIFQKFLDYPYHLTPPHLIGEVYFDKPEMGANNGIYADAYMNFRFVGFILWSILLTIILKLIDSFSKNKNIRITIATVAMPVLFLTNSALLTCLLTHGLLVSLVLLYLLPKKNNIEQEYVE
jgi:hypothetical protein